MPTLTQLEYIVAVDTFKHFGIAAQKCYVTQPTLSMQIKKAEEELGIIIFDRGKQPVLTTDIGAAVVQQARVITREMRYLTEIVADHNNEISGKLRLGIIPTIAPYLLPLFVGNFIRKYPKIQLQIREMQTDEIEVNLKNDLLDVGIMVTPSENNTCNKIVLFCEEILMYVNKDHDFYGILDKRVPSDYLAGKDIWLISDENCFRNQMLSLCSNNNYNEALPFEYDGGSLESLKRLVDKEGGVTLVPELFAQKEDFQHLKRFEEPVPLREVSLCYVRNFAKIKLLQLLADEIKMSLPKEMLNRDLI